MISKNNLKWISRAEAEEIIEKKKKKGEEILILKKISYPFWIIEYGYNIDKGIINKYKEVRMQKLVLDGIKGSFAEEFQKKIQKDDKFLNRHPTDDALVIYPKIQRGEIEEFISEQLKEFKRKAEEIEQPLEKKEIHLHEKEIIDFKRSIGFPAKLSLDRYVGVFKTELRYYDYWVACLLKRRKNARRFIVIDGKTGKENKYINGVLADDADIQKMIVTQ